MASIDAFLHLAEQPAAWTPRQRRWQQRLTESKKREMPDRLIAMAVVMVIFVIMFLLLRVAMRPSPLAQHADNTPMTVIFLSAPPKAVPRPVVFLPPTHSVVARVVTPAPVRPVTVQHPPSDGLRAVVVTATPASAPVGTFGPPPGSSDSTDRPRDLLASRPPQLPGALAPQRANFHFSTTSTGQKVVTAVASVFGGTGRPYDPCPDLRQELTHLDDPKRIEQAEERYERSCEGR